jgi:hypothetical protein
VTEASCYFILVMENVQLFAEAIINNSCTNSILLVCCHETTAVVESIVSFHPTLIEKCVCGNLSVMSFVHLRSLYYSNLLVQGKYSNLGLLLNNEAFLIMKFLRYEIYTVPNVKLMVLWDVVPCSLVDRYQHFRGTCCSISCPESFAEIGPLSEVTRTA